MKEESTTFNPTGRPPVEPSDADRLKVSRMAKMGFSQTDIAKVFGLSPKTLRKHFRKELTASSVEATFNVVETLYQMATSGKNTQAAIFWCKTRGGFRTTPAGPSVPPPPKPASPTPPSTIVVLNNDGAPRAD